jgi:hypothetical protein
VSRITERPPNWWRRIGWFVLLYLASFAVVALVAEGLKAVIPH